MTMWLIIALAGALGAGLGMVVRRATREYRTASGWDAWARTARTLRWRDRLVLLWSTTTGRPVGRDELAALGAQRSAAAHRYMTAAAGIMAWVWRVIGLAWSFPTVASAMEGEWLSAVGFAAFVVLAFAMPLLLRWDGRRAARSSDRNRLLSGS